MSCESCGGPLCHDNNGDDTVCMNGLCPEHQESDLCKDNCIRKKPKEPILTVVIPHLNNEKGLDRCLRTLELMTPHDYRVIIVNQSGRDLQGYIDEGLAHVTVNAYRNLGFAKACNTGLRMADTKYVMLCNDDVEFIYNKWFDDCLTEFDRLGDKIAGMNPGSPRNPSGTGDLVQQWEYKDVLKGELYSDEEIEEIKKKWNYGMGPGTCMFATIFRLDALLALGNKEGSPYGVALLDELFGQGSGEDYDMCRRFGLMGMQIFSGWRSIVWHWWGETKNNMPEPVENEKEGVTANHSLIAGGYATMGRKWGPARHGPNPDQNPEGWDVQSHHGPREPLDNLPWATIVPL